MSNTDMTTEQTASQLELAAQILRTRHPWELKGVEEWHPSSKYPAAQPLACVFHGQEIRLALATPPDNRQLHNPCSLTAEQVGAGWRLLTVGEKMPDGYEYWMLNEWHHDGVWTNHAVPSRNIYTTCRIPLSVPWPEVKRPDPSTRVVSEGVDSLTMTQPPVTNTMKDALRASCEKPFTLPPPPPGMQWHREDGWTAEMLPQGYRPLVIGEAGAYEVSFDKGLSWKKGSAESGPANKITILFWRTTRPLTFIHEGKTWTWHKRDDPAPCDEDSRIEILCDDSSTATTEGDCSWHGGCAPVGWRYAEPETKTVEFGPEDVPPSSALRHPSQSVGWVEAHSIDSLGVWINHETQRSYASLQGNGWLINRSLPLTGKWNPDAWEPCHRQIAV